MRTSNVDEIDTSRLSLHKDRKKKGNIVMKVKSTFFSLQFQSKNKSLLLSTITEKTGLIYHLDFIYFSFFFKLDSSLQHSKLSDPIICQWFIYSIFFLCFELLCLIRGKLN